jgi:hypothetical protein
VNQRIEHTDPLRLLRELPDGLAQMSISRLPDEHDPIHLLSVLSHAHRVLRTDGTLWLLAHHHEQTVIRGVLELGFRPLPSPTWGGALSGMQLRLVLFAKSDCCFIEERLFVPHGPRPGTAARTGRRRTNARARACVHDRTEHQRLFKRCVLAGSAFIACGVCGAPYRRACPGERRAALRRSTCTHENPAGRCLVLDPFYDAHSGTSELAVAVGRSFLGIVPPRGQS